MKKICLLLLLAFCISFCPVVSADVDIDNSKGLYINGNYVYNNYYDGFSEELHYSDKWSYDFGNGYSCSIYETDYVDGYNDYTYFGIKIYHNGELYSDSYYPSDPGDRDKAVFKTALAYQPFSSSGYVNIYLYHTDEERYIGASCFLFRFYLSDIDFTEPTFTMALNNVSDPLTDEFYVEAVNGYSERGFIKTQYQANSDDDYTAVNELIVPADTTTRFTAKELNVTKAGRYTFTLYDPSSMLKGVQVLEITSDYVAPDDGVGGDDGDEDLFNFTELPEDANVLDYIKWFFINMLELFKGIGQCFKKFFAETKGLSQMLTEFFSFMPTEFTLILTFGIMFLVLLRFLGR